MTAQERALPLMHPPRKQPERTGPKRQTPGGTGRRHRKDLRPRVRTPGLAAALENVEAFRDPNQPIGLTIPLTGVPEPKKFAWLECELESCPYITVGVEAATEALGWEMIKISSESANPGPAFQQAIDAGADYIASSGEPRACTRSRPKRRRSRGSRS